jgi:hypothetical protein
LADLTKNETTQDDGKRGEENSENVGETPGAPTSDENLNAAQEPPTTNDEEIGDLPDHSLSEADRMMDNVYGHHVHQSPGQHLNGGIANETVWQDYWRCLVVSQSSNYHVPKGKVGKRFLNLLTTELTGIRKCQWNPEKFLVFQLVMLQQV